MFSTCVKEENQIAEFPALPFPLYLTTFFTFQPDRKVQEHTEQHFKMLKLNNDHIINHTSE